MTVNHAVAALFALVLASGTLNPRVPRVEPNPPVIKSSASLVAQEALWRIAANYRVELEFVGLKSDERLAMRER